MSEREILPLPCPFCGGKPKWGDSAFRDANWIECAACDAAGPYCETPEAALDTWNAAPRKGQEEGCSCNDPAPPWLSPERAAEWRTTKCETCESSEAPSLPSRIRAIADDYTNHHYRRTLRELADEAEGEGHGP